MGKRQGKNPFDAKTYAELTGFEGRWRETWWRDDFLRLILGRSGLETAERLLDVGCGAGHWGRTLSRVLPAGLRVAGVDIEQAFVDQAAEQGAAFGLAAPDYRVASAEDLPFAAESFDLVTCQTLMIQVAEPEAVLQQMKRVLKPGGGILLAEPNNLAARFNMLLSEPRADWSEIRRLMDLHQAYFAGKKALGFGDSTLGERLPGLAAAAGFEAVEVAANENCPALFPPYASEAQQIWAAVTKGGGGGLREHFLEFFKAGGGDEAAFQALWDLKADIDRRHAEAIETGTFSGARCMPMYLVSGRKPAGQ